MPSSPSFDAVVVGAGHNGLVAATLLARRGLRVGVFEASPVVGGAVRTEYPFAKAPALGASTGAYLLGLMPPELMRQLGLSLRLIRRDPHYFLPTLDRRYLLFGSDTSAVRRQCVEWFSEADWRGVQALESELADLRADIAPSWLAEPLTAEETADRYVRPHLRRVFLDLVHGPVESYLARFGFASDLLVAMYAVTDGFSGLAAGFGHAGTGLNFLVHNMCRLPGADGTWMVVEGGMGRVTAELAALARAAGAAIRTAAPVAGIEVSAGRARGVTLESGEVISAPVVVSNTDPFRLRTLVGPDAFPEPFNSRLDAMRRPGTTMKVNLALERLPVFSCLPDDRGQFRSTIHLLPQEDVIGALRRAFAATAAGQLPDFPSIEWYTHTAVDPSLRDPEGRHNAAFFVQWVPHTLAHGTWAEAESGYVRHLVSIADRFAPGLADRILDVSALTPPGIEARFGMTFGHIHHVDNTIGFDRRMPYATPIEGLYACSAGCHPAGSVIGAAGHNAAQRILRDLDLGNA